MPNRYANAGQETSDLVSKAQDFTERAYDVAKKTADHAADRVDDLSRFGRQRPLLAMGVAFLAGFFVAKTFF